MTHRHRACWRALVVLALLATRAAPAAAQEPTLGDIVARVLRADSIAHVATWDSATHAKLLALDGFVRAQHLERLTTQTLAVVSTGGRPDYATILRLDRGAFTSLPPALADSLTKLRKIAFDRSIKDSVEHHIGPAGLDSLYAPIDDWTARALPLARGNNVERLRRYEVKYGPEAPRLNVAEALLNYLAQLPGGSPFAGDDQGPSPYEIVAAYRPVNFAAGDSAGGPTVVRPTTGAQLGLRVYNFAPACGTGSIVQRLVSPCRYSVGWFLLGPREAAPLALWRSRTSQGLYASIANYHLGYVFGQDRRLSFGVETQVLPFLY